MKTKNFNIFKCPNCETEIIIDNKMMKKLKNHGMDGLKCSGCEKIIGMFS